MAGRNETYKATAVHRACFACGCATTLFSIAKSIVAIKTTKSLLHTTLAALLGYLFADLFTAVYHWAIDNYGSTHIPFFGFQIDLFRAHHKQPWAVTKYDMARAVHIHAVAVSILVFPITVGSSNPVVLGFFGVFGVFMMFSLQIHAWAHTGKGKLPAYVRALQNAGIILRPSWHAAHHRLPFNSTYSSVSGWCDPVLDKLNFFVAAEGVLFRVMGVQPQWWSHGREVTGDSEFKFS